MTLLAALAAALALWVLWAPPPIGRLRGKARGGVRQGHGGRLAARALPALVVLAGTAAGAGVAAGPGAAVGYAVSLPVVTTVVILRRQRRRSAAVGEAAAVVSACQLLGGLLRVGHVPASALAVAARDEPILAEAAAVREVGGEVGAVLRRLGPSPGRAGLVELGVAWDVAERSGASLTATLDALVDRLAAGRAVANVVAAELSAPRATGRLLAALRRGAALATASWDPLAFRHRCPVS